MSDVPRLGPRLRAIADRVIPGRAAADLCCDHAQLAAALVAEGRVPRAIAGDINPGPLAGAAALLERARLDDGRIELRQGDGLAVLGPADELATLVIAGVGAPLAASLLARGRGQLAALTRVIVQPNHGFPKLGELRAALVELDLAIVDECLARERGRLYVTLVAEPQSPAPSLDPIARELGPVLGRGRDPLWPTWVEHERARTLRAIAGLERGTSTPTDAELLARRRQFLTMLDDLAC